MKEETILLKNVSNQKNPPDEIAQNVSKKSFSANYFSFFFRKFRILPCVQLNT